MSEHYSDEEIEKLLSAITPATWHFIDWAKQVVVRRDQLPEGVASDYHPSMTNVLVASIHARFADGDFIAAAPAIIRQLRAERDEARAEIADARFKLWVENDNHQDFWQQSPPAVGTDSAMFSEEKENTN